MAGLKQTYADDDMTIWTSGSLAVNYFHGGLSIAQADSLLASMREIHERTGTVASLSIIGEQASPPERDAQKAIVAYVNELTPAISIANWFLARGFDGAVLRAALIAMIMAGRQSYDHKVFSDGEKACAWLNERRLLQLPSLYLDVYDLLVHHPAFAEPRKNTK